MHNLTDERDTIKSYKIIISCTKLNKFSCETNLYIGIMAVNKRTLICSIFNREYVVTDVAALLAGVDASRSGS